MIASLQTRITALFLVLMVTVQAGVFALVNTVGTASARKTVGEELSAGARIFETASHNSVSTKPLLPATRTLSTRCFPIMESGSRRIS